MFSIFNCVRLFDSCIYYSEEIGINLISGTFHDLSNSLVTTIVFLINNLMMYLILSGAFIFTYTSFNISSCISFVYLMGSQICKGEFGALILVDSLQSLFDGLARGLSNFCYTVSLIP